MFDEWEQAHMNVPALDMLQGQAQMSPPLRSCPLSLPALVPGVGRYVCLSLHLEEGGGEGASMVYGVDLTQDAFCTVLCQKLCDLGS